MAELVIQTSELTRVFGDKVAVNQLGLSVPKGSVTALLGRNGSGKTTTIKMLLGLVPPSRGSAMILNCDSKNLTPTVRAKIGYLSESHFAYGWMKIRETARFQSGTFSRWNQQVFDSIIDHVGLDVNAKVSSLSRGQRACLCLALTLAPEPELLILDDPALGLDPVVRRALIEAMLAVTQDQNRTILFSSHVLDDVERVADHVAIIEEGVLRVQTSVDDFCERISCWQLEFDSMPDKLPDIPGLVHTKYLDGEIHLTVANVTEAAILAIHSVGARDVRQTDVSFAQAVVDYLSVRHGETSLLSALSKPRILQTA